jgi:hypothetical protein
MITTETVRALSDAALADEYAASYQLVVAAYRTGWEIYPDLAAAFDVICGEQIRRLIERQERAREYRAARGKFGPRH